MIWRVLRYLGIVVACLLIGVGIQLQGTQNALTLGSVVILAGMGYAVVAPVRALRRRNRRWE